MSGAPAAALQAARTGRRRPLDRLQRARLHLLRGRAAFGSSHGGDAPQLLLAAARELEPLDAGLARDTYLEALTAALFVGRLGGDVGVVEVAQAARAARIRRPQDVLLDGLAVVITDGYAAGAPLLKQAVDASDAGHATSEAIRWLWLATHAAHDLWDDESWEELCDRQVGAGAARGRARPCLPLALARRIGLHLFAGELASAAALTEELAAVSAGDGERPPAVRRPCARRLPRPRGRSRPG